MLFGVQLARAILLTQSKRIIWVIFMSVKSILGSLAALTLIAGCATSTPYQQSLDGKLGFNQQQIENDRWSVSFAGNSLTDRQTVETYLLYRAAELTTENGYDYFQIAKSDTNEDRRVIASPSSFYDPFYHGAAFRYRFYGTRGRLYPSRYGRFGRAGLHRSGFYGSRFGYSPFHNGFGVGAYDYREVTRYDATAQIVMRRGQKPDDPAYFDAAQVLSNLAGRIERPEV